MTDSAYPPDAAREPDRRSRHPGINVLHPGEDLQQRNEEVVFGFWIFLMSDAVVFALLLATYAAMARGTAGGPEPRELFDLGRALLETLVLLTSSLAFGLATVALKVGARLALWGWLGAAFLLGGVFLVLEATELLGMAADGAGPTRSGFLSAFHTLLSTHGLHVTAGMVWIVITAVQLAAFGPTSAVVSRFLRLGLFWHFLDIVWIGIFSVVYLPGVLP